MKNNYLFVFFGCFFLFSFLNIGVSQGIENGSFEFAQINPSTGVNLSSGNNSIDNWVVNSGTINYIGVYWEASDGERSVDLNGNNAGSISQTINTVVGKTYRIKSDLSGNPICTSPTVKTLSVSAAGISNTFTFDVTGNSTANMGWETESFEFTAISSVTTLTFSSLTSGLCGPVIDNIYFCDVCAFNNSYNDLSNIEGNLCVQGAIYVEDAIKLQPKSSPPSNPETGLMYFDSNLQKLRVFDGTQWQNCW